jgi:hypothetical protein
MWSLLALTAATTLFAATPGTAHANGVKQPPSIDAEMGWPSDTKQDKGS